MTFALRTIMPLLVVATVLAGPKPGFAQGLFQLADLSNDTGVTVVGRDIRFSNFGIALTDIGDFNGDGIDDIAIGSDDGDFNAPGAVFVIFGAAPGGTLPTNTALLDGSNGFAVRGLNNGEFLGRRVNGSGDINGDGLPDLVIGAQNADRGAASNGEAYVIFGSSENFGAAFDLSTLDGSNGFVLSGPVTDSARLGRGANGVGDLNNDGFDDIAIAAPSAPGGGQVFVLFGSSQGFPPTIDLTALDGADGFIIPNVSAEGFLGLDLGSAGDFNGDGIDDLIISDPSATANGVESGGKVYLVFGTSDTMFPATFDLDSIDGTNGITLTGSAFETGLAVSDAGDVNADGLHDILIGSPFSEAPAAAKGAEQPVAGVSFVVFGSREPLAESLRLDTLDGSNGFQLVGALGDSVGGDVDLAGDVNGDGFSDLIIGADADSATDPATGRAFVVLGRPGSFPARLELAALSGRDGLVLAGIDTSDRAGNSVSAAGDINQDGVDDLLVGAQNARSDTQQTAGEAYIVFGNAAPRARTNRVGAGSVSLAPADLPTLADILANTYEDQDALAGAAVVANPESPGEGRWQFSEGGAFVDVPQVSDASALVLTPSARLRFVPEPEFTGTPAQLTLRMWDGRFRNAGPQVDITDAIGALGGFANDANLVSVGFDVGGDLLFADGFE